jgi:hypothetical protein
MTVDVKTLYAALDSIADAADRVNTGLRWLAEAGLAAAADEVDLGFAPGEDPLAAPLSVLLGQVELNMLSPHRDHEHLRQALHTTAVAVLVAAEGDIEGAAVPLLEASGHAARTPCHAAFRVIFDAITDLAAVTA